MEYLTTIYIIPKDNPPLVLLEFSSGETGSYDIPISAFSKDTIITVEVSND